MQKIFYNGNIFTVSNEEKAEAFLVNNGSIVFVGTSEEVLKMKTNDTVLVDLEGHTVLPAFFAMFTKIFDKIEKNLAKKKLIDENKISVSETDDEYETFDNYDVFVNEFLAIQEQLLKQGITTITELDLNARSFTFFKKLAESEKLKIDVVGYVDIKNAKSVMDNNCKSYRKYTNHFRLGGYSLSLDGKISTGGAWLKKSYSGQHGYKGYGKYFDEQLGFIIKSAIEDKKQLVVETGGDRAVEQFVRCYEEYAKKEKIEDNYKPVLIGCNLIGKKELLKLKELDIGASFDLSEIYDGKKRDWKSVGLRNKDIKPVSHASKNKIKILFEQNLNIDIVKTLETAITRKTKDNKFIGKKHKINFVDALKILILNSATFAFDGEFKGSIENGKQANFVVLNKSIDEENLINLNGLEVKETYVLGEKIK